MCMIAGALIGAAVSAGGALLQSRQQAQQHKLQAKVFERQAQMEHIRGAQESERLEERGKRLTGQQIVNAAANGLTIESPSVQDVVADSRTEINLDRESVRFNTEVKRTNNEFRARIERFNAKQARTAGIIGAITPFVNALGSISGSGSGSTSSSTVTNLNPFTRASLMRVF